MIYANFIEMEKLHLDKPKNIEKFLKKKIFFVFETLQWQMCHTYSN